VANAGRSSRALPDPTTDFALARSGLIFAGGRATRLGGVNKALLDVGGVPIVQRILTALRPLVDEVVVLANDRGLIDHVPEARVVFDPEPHAGVLPALAAGLRNARGELCLAVACDMPFVSRQVFELLLTQQADVAIPRTYDFLEPMHAVYRRAPVLQAIEAALARGEQRMISYFGDVRVREVPEEAWRPLSPDGRAFFNVNTPEDLTQAQNLATAAPDAAPRQ
jgi:molybdenum cofactor guanylyltransferase